MLTRLVRLESVTGGDLRQMEEITISSQVSRHAILLPLLLLINSL